MIDGALYPTKPLESRKRARENPGRGDGPSGTGDPGGSPVLRPRDRGGRCAVVLLIRCRHSHIGGPRGDGFLDGFRPIDASCHPGRRTPPSGDGGGVRPGAGDAHRVGLAHAVRLGRGTHRLLHDGLSGGPRRPLDGIPGDAPVSVPVRIRDARPLI